MSEAALGTRASQSGGRVPGGVSCQRGGGRGTAGRLRVRCEAGESLEVDALLFAIGRVPQVDFLSTELLAQAHPGLHFAGDVKNGLYRQAVQDGYTYRVQELVS